MEAVNIMTTRPGRPKKDTKKGAVVHPHIGGMDTLGPKPIHGGAVSNTKKPKEGAVRKQSYESSGVGGLSKSKDSFKDGIGFSSRHGKPHKGVGGLNKKG
jgi:hypothetical protein